MRRALRCLPAKMSVFSSVESSSAYRDHITQQRNNKTHGTAALHVMRNTLRRGATQSSCHRAASLREHGPLVVTRRNGMLLGICAHDRGRGPPRTDIWIFLFRVGPLKNSGVGWRIHERLIGRRADVRLVALEGLSLGRCVCGDLHDLDLVLRDSVGRKADDLGLERRLDGRQMNVLNVLVGRFTGGGCGVCGRDVVKGGLPLDHASAVLEFAELVFKFSIKAPMHIMNQHTKCACFGLKR